MATSIRPCNVVDIPAFHKLANWHHASTTPACEAAAYTPEFNESLCCQPSLGDLLNMHLTCTFKGALHHTWLGLSKAPCTAILGGQARGG
eukprot:689575-Pelagomonas_calceolata.AAC.4